MDSEKTNKQTNRKTNKRINKQNVSSAGLEKVTYLLN